MVRLTDRPDMTFDVYRGRKTTMQQQQQQIVQGQQYFPFYQHVCGRSDDSQISECQICIIHDFFKDNCCPDGYCQCLKTVMVSCIRKQSVVAEKVYIGVKWTVNLSEK